MLWGRPRLTADVDVTVRLRPTQEPDAIAGFRRDMEAAGFRLRISDPEFLARTRVLPFLHTPTGLPLDVVLSGPGLEDAFIKRAILVDIEGLPVPVVSPEDLIVMKILAGRAKDLEDVRTVLTQRREKLDIRYIRSVLGTLEQALGRSDLLPLLQSELNRLSP